MELDELRQMSAPDLGVKERETREEIFRLRLKLRTNQLDNHASYRHARRNLARIVTLIGEKTRGQGAAESAGGASKQAAGKNKPAEKARPSKKAKPSEKVRKNKKVGNA